MESPKKEEPTQRTGSSGKSQIVNFYMIVDIC